MIHYHGTPITPKSELLGMRGRHFCVSFAEPRDIDECMRIGQSLMLDNGAFTAFTQGRPLDVFGFYAWVEQHLSHPHWAVVPDVIEGTIEQQRDMMRGWPFPKDLSAPVWHLGLSIDWLLELIDEWPRICLGSSAEYWKVGSPAWTSRMDEVFEAITSRRRYLPWIHGMRMLSQSGERWPLASADSTNVARNYKRNREQPDDMASRIDSIQPKKKWESISQMRLV